MTDIDTIDLAPHPRTFYSGLPSMACPPLHRAALAAVAALARSGMPKIVRGVMLLAFALAAEDAPPSELHAGITRRLPFGDVRLSYEEDFAVGLVPSVVLCAWMRLQREDAGNVDRAERYADFPSGLGVMMIDASDHTGCLAFGMASANEDGSICLTGLWPCPDLVALHRALEA